MWGQVAHVRDNTFKKKAHFSVTCYYNVRLIDNVAASEILAEIVSHQFKFFAPDGASDWAVIRWCCFGATRGLSFFLH